MPGIDLLWSVRKHRSKTTSCTAQRAIVEALVLPFGTYLLGSSLNLV